MHNDPDDLSIEQRYKILIGSIVPRPIAWVSTISTAGLHNLAPFSFFTGVGSNPMTLLLCPANKPDGSDKDTLKNAAPHDQGGTGQFVVNIVPARLAPHMAATAEPLPHGQSEFQLANLTPAPSVRVAPPRVAESPIAFECQTILLHRTNPGQPSGGNILLGRVLHLHIDDSLLNDRFHINQGALDALGRMGGLDYCTTRQRLSLPMGAPALHAPFSLPPP
ncbi:MAG: flavin reductase family protein [Phycisphaeraceae bacterium]|nr:MAG: flavin reductase family protein [Phycisphaeraceae bacterium]